MPGIASQVLCHLLYPAEGCTLLAALLHRLQQRGLLERRLAYL